EEAPAKTRKKNRSRCLTLGRQSPLPPSKQYAPSRLGRVRKTECTLASPRAAHKWVPVVWAALSERLSRLRALCEVLGSGSPSGVRVGADRVESLTDPSLVGPRRNSSLRAALP